MDPALSHYKIGIWRRFQGRTTQGPEWPLPKTKHLGLTILGADSVWLDSADMAESGIWGAVGRCDGEKQVDSM